MADKYYDVILTDVQLHTQIPPKPKPLFRSILQSMRNNKPGRTYSSNISFDDSGTFQFSIPLESKTGQEMLRAQKAGKKIRIFMPKSGLPVYLGKDMIEKLDAEKKKGNI